jgi:hypothetical protein
MEFSFTEALEKLGRNAAFRIINEARPATDYLFETLLPEQTKTSYYVESGFMLIRATMAGLTAMDSPYAPGGVIEASTFLEQSAKLGSHNKLTEKALREMQEILQRRGLQGEARTDFISGEALNFMEKVVVQGHMDTAEWLRARALYDGAIDWTFNKLELKVDYGVPSAHIFAKRTGNDAYIGSTSKFWTDHYEALRLLRYNVRAIIVHTDLMLKMINQDANKFEVTAQTGNQITVRRFRTRGNIDVVSGDTRDTVTFIMYDLEGEVLDPTDTSKTIKIPFAAVDKLLYVGNNRRSGYRVGEGSTPDPVRDMALGYTHIAPTVEGGGTPGRWGKMFTPEMAAYELHAQGVSNLLPVREDVTATEAKTVTLSSDVT